ncbi:unnamed protein product [Amoebophrya sp. A25]|nr:unnamed protein product [Amoebophrya sp. A25]|eukprot:GSA25T00026495001.1
MDCAVSCQAPAPPDETSAFRLERSSCYVALAEQNDGNCKWLKLIGRKSLRSQPTHARWLVFH